MILLLDIGNSHLHLGLANSCRVLRQVDLPTAELPHLRTLRRLDHFVGKTSLAGACLCSVVPRLTPLLRRHVRRRWNIPCLELTHRTVHGIGIDYPHPETIGPDRLANAVAVSHLFGVPAVVIDFGTAVTLDVVDRQRNYVGGIIAPGLAVMTDYLHEKTALLPRIQVRETRAALGKSTEEAMRIAAVHGYRGLIRALLGRVQEELQCQRLPVVATGGYAKFMARGLPEITAVNPVLTLEGLRLVWGSPSSAAPQKHQSLEMGGCSCKNRPR
jgi:type III pantothenate kinase